MYKVCSNCKLNKALEEFAIQSTGKLGRRADCKGCVKRFIRSEYGLIKSMFATNKSKAKKRGYSAPSYTEKELQVWVLAQPQFKQLYQAWVTGGFVTNNKPSIDRLDDYISYTLTNIQLVTHKDNIDKYYSDRIAGNNTKTLIAVDQLDLNGNFIQRFHSIAAAAREVSGLPANISNVCKGLPITKNGTTRTWIPSKSYGYKWRHSTVPNNNLEKILCNKNSQALSG